jgi:hypothetical protein
VLRNSKSSNFPANPESFSRAIIFNQSTWKLKLILINICNNFVINLATRCHHHLSIITNVFTWRSGKLKFSPGNPLFMIQNYICLLSDLEKHGKIFSNCGKSTFLTLTLRFHALINSGIKIFGFGSEKWISLVGKKLPYFSNPLIDKNRYYYLLFKLEEFCFRKSFNILACFFSTTTFGQNYIP